MFAQMMGSWWKLVSCLHPSTCLAFVRRIFAVFDALSVPTSGSRGQLPYVAVSMKISPSVIDKAGGVIQLVIGDGVIDVVIKTVIVNVASIALRTVASGEPPLEIGGSFHIDFPLSAEASIHGGSDIVPQSLVRNKDGQFSAS